MAAEADGTFEPGEGLPEAEAADTAAAQDAEMEAVPEPTGKAQLTPEQLTALKVAPDTLRVP